MSKQTAHEKYEEQVKNGIWRPYDDAQMAAKQRQVDGLVAERKALMTQIDGLLAERQAILDKLTAARATADKWRRAYTGEIIVSMEESNAKPE